MAKDRQGQLLEIGDLLKALSVLPERRADIRNAAAHIGNKIGLKGRYRRIWHHMKLMPENPAKAVAYLERLRKSARLLAEAVEVELPLEVGARMPEHYDDVQIRDIGPVLRDIENAARLAQQDVNARDKKAKYEPKDGRKINYFALNIAIEAARAFEHLTGNKPAMSPRARKPSEPGYALTKPGGPFYNLVESLFDKFGVEANAEHYAGEAIRAWAIQRGNPAKSPKAS